MNNPKKIPKLVISITFFFVPQRLIFLRQIASQFTNLAEEVAVFIITNDPDKKSDILQLLADYQLNLQVVSPTLLGHPYLLTWCHFEIFRTLFKSDPTITHFMYLEDDIYITPDNIIYWLEGRENLRPFGVIPSFLRYEIDQKTEDLFSVDITRIINYLECPIIEFKNINYTYLNLPELYQGMYLLDRELMEEYLTDICSSPDFFMEGIRSWGIREKATLGVTYCHIPKGFISRNLIGYHTLSQQIDPRCLIHHIANNYITYSNSPYGKIPIKSLIQVPTNEQINQRNNMINHLIIKALEFNKQGQFAQAIALYQQALIIDKNNPNFFHDLTVLYLKNGNILEALNTAKITLSLDNSNIRYYITLGQILEKLEQLRQNDYNCYPTINLTQEKIDAFLGLGDFLVRDHKYKEAIGIYQQALLLKQKDPTILERIAQTFALDNNQDQALLYNGYVKLCQENYEEALPKFAEFFSRNIGNGFDYTALADCYHKTEQEDQARLTYLEGLEKYPDHEYLYLYFILFLQQFGYTEEDFILINQLLDKMPNNLTGKLEVKRLLPIVYDTPEEIIYHNNRFQEYLNYLDELIKSKTLENPVNLNSAIQSINAKTNFYLIYQYQYQNYREQQKQYGDFVHYVMGLKYPQFINPLPMPSLTDQGKIKIAYLSDQIGNSSASKWIIGWLENCDRAKFEIYIYATSKRIVEGEITEKIKQLCDYFYYIPDNLEAISKQILENQLHILVFLAIGMWAETTQLASLRLAPIQCTTWGHPSTSGLPTIDYYLSGDLIEPENAQKYYTEKLIRLPNLGISYAKPTVYPHTKNRSDFNLSEEKIIYLSCQAIFKYLPQYDYIFPEIVLKNPQAQFIFILRKGYLNQQRKMLLEKFTNRLKQAFSKVNLTMENYCLFLPQQSGENYHNLLYCCDVFLDTLAFSGGHTAFDAIACNLPIVTCPGELMFSRQSYGILKMLGVEETIANNAQEYIDIAVKLGLDQKWRNNIKEKIKNNLDRIFYDVECVKGLEQFYQKVVQQ